MTKSSGISFRRKTGKSGLDRPLLQLSNPFFELRNGHPGFLGGFGQGDRSVADKLCWHSNPAIHLASRLMFFGKLLQGPLFILFGQDHVLHLRFVVQKERLNDEIVRHFL